MECNTVMVTGAAGFIGFHLCRKLLENGKTVIGVDNLNDYYDPNLKKARLSQLTDNPAFTHVNFDIADRPKMAWLFGQYRFDAVVNLAAQAGVRYSLKNPHAYVDTNLVGFVNILEGCRHSDVKHLIYASSSSVYGANTKMPFSVHHNVDHPVSLYAATKKANELMAHTYAALYKIPSTGLRFFTVYGPWGRPDMVLFLFTKAILDGKPINVYNHGKMQRDFTYIDDIIDGIIKSMTWLNQADKPQYEIFNLGESATTSVNNLIKLLEKHIGQKAIKEYKLKEPGDVPQTYANITKAKTMIGYKPKTPLEKGIPLFIEWYRDHLKKE